MLRSFLKLGFRNLFRKNRLYTLVNIIGLAVGLAAVWLVSLFIYDEYNFDRHYTATDRIYRVVLDFTSDGNITSWAKTSPPIGKYMQGTYSEIEQVARIRKNPGTDLLSVNEKQFYEEKLFFADSTFFKIFDIPFIQGNRDLALSNKHSIVVTEALAMKFFGTTDVVGKTIRYDHQIDFKVTGVMEPMHANSHFTADAFVTFSTLNDIFSEQRLNHWGQFDHYTYVKLAQGASADQLESKLPDLIKRNAPEWVAEKEALFLQPLTSIHLHSERKDEVSPNSNEKYSYILGTIALFILLMACANFINLSTATQLARTKETAIQKALGANSNTLSTYFFIESGIVCGAALVFSIVLAYLTLPYFNLSTGKQVNLLSSEWLIPPAIGITLLITLITGFFPAAQTHRQIANIRKTKGSGTGKSNFRTGLVVFQFSVSIFLIMSTWVVFSQLRFLESTRFGFQSDNVIVVPVKDRSKNDRFKTLSNEIENLPGISKVSFSSSTPGANNSLTYTYTISDTELGEQPLATFLTDDNFFELYQIKIKEGRALNPLSADTLADVVLNEAAVKMFNLSQPIGSLVTGKVKGRVVGVIENFNHTSLHNELQPVIMYAFKPTFRLVSVKLSDPQIGIAALEKKWPELYDGYPLEYSFLNDQMQQLYGAELQLTEAYTAFSLIAIIIAGVGLIGLTTYLLNRKLKEISIRKIFGSSITQIVKWVYSGYIPIILISTALAGIAGYYFLESWLNNFSYRIELKLIYFVLPPLLMTIILLITTGFQSVRASLTNPANYLREE